MVVEATEGLGGLDIIVSNAVGRVVIPSHTEQLQIQKPSVQFECFALQRFEIFGDPMEPPVQRS